MGARFWIDLYLLDWFLHLRFPGYSVLIYSLLPVLLMQFLFLVLRDVSPFAPSSEHSRNDGESWWGARGTPWEPREPSRTRARARCNVRFVRRCVTWPVMPLGSIDLEIIDPRHKHDVTYSGLVLWLLQPTWQHDSRFKFCFRSKKAHCCDATVNFLWRFLEHQS